MRIRPCLAALLVTLITFGATAQDSELEPSMVFFELYMRAAPPTKTASYVKSVQQEIQQHRKYSLLSRSDAYTRIQTIMVTPAKRVNDEKLLAIEKMVAEGDKLIYTNPKKAIEVLHEAKLQLKEIVENISLDGKIRRDYFTTQMLLVRSHMDNGNPPKAKEIMAEIVRTFEDEYPVDTKNYHPRVVDLYKGVLRDMKDRRTASLTITTNPPGCNVYLNGRAMKQKSPYTFKGLYPGSIRVNVQKGDLQSMVRKLDVGPKGAAKLDIDLEYESALNFTETTFGLTFSNEDSLKRNMLNYTAKLGNFLEVDYVMLVGVVDREGPKLVSYQIDIKKKAIVREKALSVKANVVSNRRIAEMSAFLANVDMSKVTAKGDTIILPWYKNWIGWTLIGGGVVLAGVSIPFFVNFLDLQECAEDPHCPTAPTKDQRIVKAEEALSASQTGGILAGVGGAVIVAGALVMALVDLEEEVPAEDSWAPSPPEFFASPVLLPGGGGFSASLRF